MYDLGEASRQAQPDGFLDRMATTAVRHDGPMRITDFALERYFARWEFAVEYLLCASDVEGYAMADLLRLADDETRALWDGLRLGYTESSGHPLLRAEIAVLYEDIDPDDILVFAGAEEAIFCLANVLLGPGDHAVVTWPGYQSLYEVGRAAGAEVTLHELHEADALGPRRRTADRRSSAGNAARRRQRPAQPDRDAADPRRVGAARPTHWQIGTSISSPTRSTATSSWTRRTGSSPAPTRSRAGYRSA